jgi:hypothetical protein
MLKTLFTARIAAIAAAVAVLVGGVATAAATGYLPTPLGGHPAVVPAHSSATAPPTPSTTGQTTNATTEDRTSPTTTGSPAPSVAGLCNAYTAGAGSDHGKSLDNPAFGALIAAAGGRDKVDAYCADLLAGQQGHNGNSNNGGNSNSGGNTNNNGKGHDPKGPPANHPDHTTGPPSTHSNH